MYIFLQNILLLLCSLPDGIALYLHNFLSKVQDFTFVFPFIPPILNKVRTILKLYYYLSLNHPLQTYDNFTSAFSILVPFIHLLNKGSG